MTIRKVGKSKILIETVNFTPSTDAKVMLFAVPNAGTIYGEGGRQADAYGIRAVLQPEPVPTVAKAMWLVEAELPKGYTSLQVHAVAAP